MAKKRKKPFKLSKRKLLALRKRLADDLRKHGPRDFDKRRT